MNGRSVGHDEHVLDRGQAYAELAPQPAAVLGAEQSSVGGAKRGERAVVPRGGAVRFDVVIEPGGEPVGAAFETAVGQATPIHRSVTAAWSVRCRQEQFVPTDYDPPGVR